MRAWVIKNERYVFFIAVLTGLLMVVFFYRVGVSQEAVVRAGVGSDLLAGLVEGRQGLIGSLKWPPLPTLLVLPFVRIPGLGGSGLAFPVLNAILSAFMLTLLNTWWKGFGIPRVVRYPLLALFQLSPPVIGAVLTGSSVTVMLLMLTAGAYFLLHWLRTLDVRSLAYLGVLGGLSVVTRYQTFLLVILTAVLIVVRIRRRREPAFRTGTVLAFLIPGIYTVALWFIANWLIMADPAFFLRGLSTRARIAAEVTELDVEWYLYMVPVLLVLIPHTFTRENVRRGRARKTVSLGLVVIVLVAAVAWPYVTEFVLSEFHASYFGRHHERLRQVDEIVTHLERQPEAKVFVSGYTGYHFVARTRNRDQFIHLMNLDPREIERRAHGQPLFFLVPRPKGLNRWEDVNLQAPWLFDGYMKHVLADGELRMTFVLEKEWPDWHLIEVIRAERPGP
ncbi:MAG TPA: hypothetical protein VMZ92_18830 [Planctomycetota bacterium]|nr:hypothetical protein [Planctomycetota bacterium]